MYCSRIVYLRATRCIYNPSAGMFIIIFIIIEDSTAVFRLEIWSPATCRFLRSKCYITVGGAG